MHSRAPVVPMWMLVCAFLVPVAADEQPEVLWEVCLEGPLTSRGLRVVSAGNGEYIVAGSAAPRPSAPPDAYLARIDASGHLLWESLYGGDRAEEATAVLETPSGELVVCGVTSSFASPGDEEVENVYLFETNDSGAMNWWRSLGGTGSDFGYDVAIDHSGAYVVAGTLDGHAYLCRTSPLGDLLWERTFDGSVAYSVAETSDEGYIVAGVTSVEGRSLDPFILKTNREGDLLWTRRYGGPYYDERCFAREVTGGGFIVTGAVQLGEPFQGQAFLIRTDPTGDILWEKTFGGSRQDYGFFVDETRDGGFVIAGLADSGQEDSHGLLLKTDADGELQWEKHVGGTGLDSLQSVHETDDGGYVAAGSSSPRFPPGGPRGIRVVRLGSAPEAPRLQLSMPTSLRAEGSALATVRLRSLEETQAFSFGFSSDPTLATLEGIEEGPDLVGIGGADFYSVEPCPSGEPDVLVVSVVLGMNPRYSSLPAGSTLEVVSLQLQAIHPGIVPLRFVECAAGSPAELRAGAGADATAVDTRDGRVVFTRILYVRGDANADGSVDISDPIRIIQHLFQGMGVSCLAACDVDGLSDVSPHAPVDITDAIYLLSYLFRSGPSPILPFPECGSGDSNLPCEEFAPCQ